MVNQHTNPISLTGQRFGRYTVISEAPRRKCLRYWNCLCDCGTERVVCQGNLLNGHSGSCGCLSREKTAERNRTHGLTNTPEWYSWTGMLRRCTNCDAEDYHRYGGRGIKVCERWLKSFENFFSDMGLRPTPRHTLDRKDNNGNYEPSNCRWATATEQANNRRTNHRITYKGETATIAEWAVKVNISPYTITYRLNVQGWTVERTLSEPIKQQGKWPPVTFNGITRSIKAWSDLTGVPYKVLTQRIHKLRWPLQRAFTEPVRTCRR